MTRAYLVGFINRSTLQVEIINVYSESAQQLTVASNKWFAFDICEACGKDYQAASDAMEIEIQKPYYAWVKALYKPRVPPKGPLSPTNYTKDFSKRGR